jgi:hypothetical protein
MKTSRHFFRVILPGACACALLAAGCGSGSGGGSNGGDFNSSGGGAITNTLPAPEGASRARLVHGIGAVLDDRKYRLRVGGDFVTGVVASGQEAVSGDLPTGNRRFAVVDTRFDVPVSEFERTLGPGVTTVILHRPEREGGLNFGVTVLEPNIAPANRDFAGVRVAHFAAGAVPVSGGNEFTFTFDAPGVSRSLPGTRFGAFNPTALRPGTYRARVTRPDGTVILDAPVTLPDANRRYTLLLRDRPAGEGGGVTFDLLTDQ